MTLPPQVQTLVDQIVQVCGWQAIRPVGLDIRMDDKGIVQRVEPQIVLKREKATVTANHDNALSLQPCGFRQSEWIYDTVKGHFRCPCGKVIDRPYPIRA